MFQKKNHKDAMILKIQEWIEINFIDGVSIEILAKKAEMSPRNFNQDLKPQRGKRL
jgi:transcriptional regulator GlxA family with amidase domain